jgi:hypothetical protein
VKPFSCGYGRGQRWSLWYRIQGLGEYSVCLEACRTYICIPSIAFLASDSCLLLACGWWGFVGGFSILGTYRPPPSRGQNLHAPFNAGRFGRPPCIGDVPVSTGLSGTSMDPLWYGKYVRFKWTPILGPGAILTCCHSYLHSQVSLRSQTLQSFAVCWKPMQLPLSAVGWNRHFDWEKQNLAVNRRAGSVSPV